MSGRINGPPWVIPLYRYITGHGGLWIGSVFPLSFGHYCKAFVWGVSFSPVLVLGLWLVARDAWWESAIGRTRAILFGCAYLYGSILTAVTQRWLHALAPNGHPAADGPYADYAMKLYFPGTQINAYYNDCSRPVVDLLLLFVVVMVCMPMMAILGTRNDLQPRRPRFSLRLIFGWIAFIAFTLSYAKFLGAWYAPQTGYASLSFSATCAEVMFELLPATVTVLAAVLMFVSIPRRPFKIGVLAILAILALDSIGDRLFMNAIQGHFGWERRDSPLAGPDRWTFQAGRIFGAWVAISMASSLGGVLLRHTPYAMNGSLVPPKTGTSAT